MRLFAIVEEVRFKNVIQTVLDIDFAIKIPILTNDLLQSCHTIKRKTMDRFDKGIVKYNGHVAISTNIWKDDATKTSYNANIMHLIDDYFVLHARVVSCDAFSKVTSHTAPSIHRDFVNSVRPFISWKNDNVTVQAPNRQMIIKSDAASNNTRAEGMSSQFEVDLCFCHRILTCISYVLKKQTRVVSNIKQPHAYLFYDKSEIVFDMIDDSKTLVNYM